MYARTLLHNIVADLIVESRAGAVLRGGYRDGGVHLGDSDGKWIARRIPQIARDPIIRFNERR